MTVFESTQPVLLNKNKVETKANKPAKKAVPSLLKSTIKQTIIKPFVHAVVNCTRQLSFNNRFIDQDKFRMTDEVDFSSIVFDENHRLIFQPGETAFMKAEYKQQKPYSLMEPRIIFLVGTEYGLAIMYGRVNYEVSDNAIRGDVPQLNTSMRLRLAATRYLCRIGKMAEDKASFASDQDVMEWLLSPTFRQECAEQAALDKANGIELGDGMTVQHREPKRLSKPNHSAKSDKPRKHHSNDNPYRTKLTSHENNAKKFQPKNGKPEASKKAV